MTITTGEPSADGEPGTPNETLDAARRASDLLERAKALASADDDSDEPVPPDDLAEAISLLDQLVAEFGAHEDVVVRERVARAVFWKSQALFDLGHVEEALAEMDGLKRKIEPDAPEPLRRVLLHALFMTAFTLRGGGAAVAETAVAICRDAVERFGNERELWFRDWVLTVMVEMGEALEFLGRTEEGLALRDAIAARFRDDPDENLRERAARVAERMGERFAASSA